MLTGVKNQLRVCLLSLKYNIMREMVNKVTFLTNVCFMVLNNASILVQWFILFRLREDVGGYTLREIMLLWGLTSASFGLSHILFARAFSLSELIIKGKLDSYLVQPKNVLVSVITSSTHVSAIGDFLYGVLLIGFCGLGLGEWLLAFLFTVTGTVIFTAFALLLGSLSFWLLRMDMLENQVVMGMAVWHPVHIIGGFDVRMLVTVTGYACLLLSAAVAVFYRGLRRYASGNLMEARL